MIKKLLQFSVLIFLIPYLIISCNNQKEQKTENKLFNDSVLAAKRIDSLLSLKNKIFLGFSYLLNKKDCDLLFQFYKSKGVFKEDEFKDIYLPFYLGGFTYEYYVDAVFYTNDNLKYIRLKWGSYHGSGHNLQPIFIKSNNHGSGHNEQLIELYSKKYGKPKKVNTEILTCYENGYGNSLAPGKKYNYKCVTALWENDTIQIILNDKVNFNSCYQSDGNNGEEPGIYYYSKLYLIDKEKGKHLMDSTIKVINKKKIKNTINNI